MAEQDQDVEVLFSGNIEIEYGQFYIDVLEPDDDYLDPQLAFENQENGLCGAAQLGKVFFVVGPQSGSAVLDIELYRSEPELNERYEEIVEVPFTRGNQEIALCEWGGEEISPLALPEGDYSIRYSILGMALDYADDSDWDAPIEGQKHLIQIWPSEKSHEKIVKVTSEVASYWHREWGSQSIEDHVESTD